MKRYRHVLMVGGTGMLHAASVNLAQRADRLSSVARTETSLRRLASALKPGSGLHHPLPLDWSEPDQFLEGIRDHMKRTEPPDLVVAWIHDNDVAMRLVLQMAEGTMSPRFFHIIGSASADPSHIADRCASRVPSSMRGSYHQVILGAREEDGRARWLTDEEISDEVLKAIDTRQPRLLVGELPTLGGLHP